MKDFEELYQLYQKDIYFFLLKLTGYEVSLAEELTQETFYQAFFSLKNFRGECAIKSWLCQIAKNTYYKYLREVVKQRKWVICLLSFGYTLLWGLLGCYNTTGNLL